MSFLWSSEKRVPDLIEPMGDGGSHSSLLVENGLSHMPPRRHSSMVNQAVLALALTLLTAGIWLCSLRRPDFEQDPTEATVELNALLDHSKCHTAVVGEKCNKDVNWAMSQGINGHPEWYTKKCPALHPMSSFEEFQTCVYLLNRESCPHLPCKGPAVTRQRAPEVKVPMVVHHQVQDDVCRTAALGDTCYGEIAKAISDSDSSVETLEEAQKALHHSGSSACPRPCECGVPKPDSQCYKHVEWALNGGLQKHPFWYMGLSEDATFSEVQEYLHKKQSCPRPCHELPGSHGTGSKHPIQTLAGRASSSQHKDDTCRTVSSSEMCYTNVLYGMRRGLSEHPEWFPGLDETSSFEDFQAVLHRNPDLKCPKPCACKTAKYEDSCYKQVKWVLNEGLQKHPEWYPDVTKNSSWEVVQAHIHKDDKTKCGKPCTPNPWRPAGKRP